MPSFTCFSSIFACHPSAPSHAQRLGSSNKLAPPSNVQANPSWLRHVQPSKSFIPCVAGRSAKLFKASRRRAIVIHRRADGRSSDSSIVPTGAYLQDCCAYRSSTKSSIAPTGAYLQDCCADGRSTKSSIAPMGNLQELSHRRVVINYHCADGR